MHLLFQETDDEDDADPVAERDVNDNISVPQGKIVIACDSDRIDGIPAGEITLTAAEINAVVDTFDLDQLCDAVEAADTQPQDGDDRNTHGQTSGGQSSESSQQQGRIANKGGRGGGSKGGGTGQGGAAGGAGGGGKGKRFSDSLPSIHSVPILFADDPPRRPASSPPSSVASSEGAEDEKIDPSIGHEGPDKRTKLPKLTETQKEHQEWRWLMLVSF